MQRDVRTEKEIHKYCINSHKGRSNYISSRHQFCNCFSFASNLSVFWYNRGSDLKTFHASYWRVSNLVSGSILLSSVLGAESRHNEFSHNASWFNTDVSKYKPRDEGLDTNGDISPLNLSRAWKYAVCLLFLRCHLGLLNRSKSE